MIAPGVWYRPRPANAPTAIYRDRRRSAVDDPVIKNKTGGHPAWGEAHIEKFIARHPLGTKAYLALRLLLDTGVRRGDVVRLGRQHIRHDLLIKAPHGWLSIVQRKTGTLLEVLVTNAL